MSSFYGNFGGSNSGGGGGDSSATPNWIALENEDGYIENKPAIRQDATNAYGVVEGRFLNNQAGSYAHAEGRDTKALGSNSHAEGEGGTFTLNSVQYVSQAKSRNAHTEGYLTYADGGANDAGPHAEGTRTVASAGAAHAEGGYTTASAVYSHAEGNGSIASNSAAHAEGSYTLASGEFSHAEGRQTTSSGSGSHASGSDTVANHANQFVFGQANIIDPSAAETDQRGTYIEIVGNGNLSSTAGRSNARTLDWEGNEVLAGKLTLGADPINAMDAVPYKMIEPLVLHVQENEGSVVLDQTAETIVQNFGYRNIILERIENRNISRQIVNFIEYAYTNNEISFFNLLDFVAVTGDEYPSYQEPDTT